MEQRINIGTSWCFRKKCLAINTRKLWCCRFDLFRTGKTNWDAVENSQSMGRCFANQRHMRHHQENFKINIHRWNSRRTLQWGNWTKILHFVETHIIKDNLFPVPPLLIQVKTDWKEMYQVLNCGTVWKCTFLKRLHKDIIAISKSFNVDAQIVGRSSWQPDECASVNTWNFEY
jgi:hypothetical protein